MSLLLVRLALTRATGRKPHTSGPRVDRCSRGGMGVGNGACPQPLIARVINERTL